VQLKSHHVHGMLDAKACIFVIGVLCIKIVICEPVHTLWGKKLWLVDLTFQLCFLYRYWYSRTKQMPTDLYSICMRPRHWQVAPGIYADEALFECCIVKLVCKRKNNFVSKNSKSLLFEWQKTWRFVIKCMWFGSIFFQRCM